MSDTNGNPMEQKTAKIIRGKRECGFYCHWFAVLGIDQYGIKTWFMIREESAKTYKEAIAYWEKSYGKTCKAISIQKTQPMDLRAFSYC